MGASDLINTHPYIEQYNPDEESAPHIVTIVSSFLNPHISKGRLKQDTPVLLQLT